jgi:phospholipase/lecithinase/hemolysin
MPELPPEYLDPTTPPEVVVTDRLRPPVEDPRLGIELGRRETDVPAPPTDPVHALVTVGDSLTHGLTSGAVSRNDLSWPAIVARCLDVQLLAPSYGGPLGGLPFNIEGLLRELQRQFGERISGVEGLRLPFVLHQIADQNEDYWERGDGSRPPRTDLRYHNVGIYGWDIRDSLSYTAGRAAARIAANPAHDDLLGAVPSNGNDIAASSVLAPFGVAATQLDAAAWHGRNGGIDTLVVILGGNNALRAVSDKKVAWSGDGFADLDRKEAYNVWRPSHFAAEFAELVRAVEAISARRVVLATVPHVTIAPIAKGVNPQEPGAKWRPGSRYFPYYTDPWIDEAEFRPTKHRHLTHQQARAVDSAIDQYNETISEAVRQARGRGRDWFLFDLCGILDGLAFRRFATDPAAIAHNEWQGYQLPAPIADLDTRFFRSDATGRLQGGLFGLDGVHPTTSGYGIVADEILSVLATAGVAAKRVDFAALRRQDTLNQDPPALMTAAFDLAAPFLTRLVSRAPI